MMRTIKVIALMAEAWIAMAVFAEDSVPFRLDTRSESVEESSIEVTWDAAWIGGDEGATVVIADNGSEVKRTTGVGEFVYEPPVIGRHELTYTTYIDGIAQEEVYSAVLFTTALACNHSTTNSNAHTATCTEAGYTGDKVCNICGEVVETGVAVAALGHLMDDGVVTKEPTVSEEGVMTYSCVRCGIVMKTESIPKLILPPTFTISESGVLTSVALNGSTEVIIPHGVTSIGEYAFRSCSGLASVTIPDGVTSIERAAFIRCSGLASVTIPGSVKSIGNWAFDGCNKLENVHISDLAAWCEISFTDNPLAHGGKLYLNGEELVGHLQIPNEVRVIGDYAFYNCGGLTSVTIPDSVTSIGNYAFRGCSELTSVTVPDGIASFGAGVFGGCTGLADEKGFVIMGNVLFAYYGDGPDVSIPYGVTNIMKDAFSSCDNFSITSVTIPSGVTNIGDNTFCGLLFLHYVSIPDSVTSIGQGVFNEDSPCIDRTTIPGASLVNGWVIRNSSSSWLLSSHLDLAGVRGIAANAFGGCGGLTSVTIGNGVTSIGDYAFSDCEQLVKVTISSDVVSIGNQAFNRCKALKSILVDENNPNYSSADGSLLSKDGKHLITGCAGEGEVTIPAGVTHIEDYSFEDCVGLVSVEMPNSVIDIGRFAFFDCSRLISVRLSSGITNISPCAFAGCNSLVDVSIPEGVVVIGEDAFARCGKLASIIIPNSVTKIGIQAFIDCDSLTSVTIPSGVAEIRGLAFADCDKLTSVVFMGDAPACGVDSFRSVASGCVGYVKKSASGFPAEGEDWNGLRIEYLDPIPSVAVDAAPEAVTNAIEAAGFADAAAIKAAIGGEGAATKYAAFREWAGSVKGAVGSAGAASAAGEAAVVANTNAAAAWLLGAERLFDKQPTIGLEAVSVGRSIEDNDQGGGLGTGQPTMTVSVVVRDGEEAVQCAAEKVRAMFEATSDLGDWDGTVKLVPSVTVEGNDGATMRFKVTPGDGASDRAFLRVKVK